MLATPTITVENGSWGLHNKLMIPRGNMSGGIYHANPPGFFSTFKANGGVTLTGIYPLEATDGRGVIGSDQYKPLHRRSTSLQCAEGEDSKYISFLSLLRVPLNFDKLGKEGTCHDLAMMPLCQSHVLWCYMPRIMVVEDGKYLLALRSVGPHLSESVDEIDDSSDENSEDSDDSEDSSSGSRSKLKIRVPRSGAKNVPPGQSAPPIANAFLWTTDGNCVTNATFDLVPSVDGSLLVSKPFTLEELRALTYDGKHMHMCWNIIVPRSYFDLSSVIDLTATPTVPASATATVEKILRGEKPHDWDFKIMGGFGGSGDASIVYYMHSAALESKSPTAKMAAAALPGIEKDRGARVSLDANGLAAAVQIAYGVEVPLPKTINRDMAITLEGMFDDHFTSVVVPQWEREICRRALALDVRNATSSSMVELLRLLNAIWEMPYGYFPVAKRVAVGVLADMMHLGPHANVLDFVQNAVLPSFHESGMNPTNLLTVLSSLAIHLNTIPDVSKSRSTTTENPIRISNRSGAASIIGKTVEKEAEQTPSTPPSETNHVELKMSPAELPYPEESTDIDSASVPATRSCSIL